MPRGLSLVLATVLTVAPATACGTDQPVGTEPDAEYALRLVGSLPAMGVSGQVLPPIEIEAALVSPAGPAFTGDIQVTLQAGAGTLSGTTLRAAEDGRVIFDDLVIMGSGAHVLGVQSSGLDPLELAPISLSAPPPPLVAAAALLDAIDAGNAGTGADLRVRLRLSADHADVNEYRLVAYAQPSGGTAGPTREEILALPADRFLAVRPDEDLQWISFGSEVLDVHGTAIVEATPYRVVVVAIPADVERASVVSGATPPLTLSRASYIETIATINAGTGGLALDDDGNLYMADFGATLDGPPGQVVYRITPERRVTIFAQGFQGASGNAFDTDGNLFQSSIVGGFVSRVAPDGTAERYVEGISQPVGIAVAPEGELYIAACGANAIVHVSSDRVVSTYFTGNGLLSCPNGIALAADGTLYVANFGNGAVIEISPSREGSVLAQLPGGNLGHLSLVGERLYVAARGGSRLYELDLDGAATVIAGTGVRGLRDGTALEATLSLTNDVVVSGDGRTLYFNDVIGTGSRVIRPVAVRALHLVPGGQ